METFIETPNCTGTDPDAFFTEEGSGTYTDIIMLKKVCGNCAAVKECLDYALRHDVKGYWGNTNENQRSKIRKQLNIIPRPLYQDY